MSLSFRESFKKSMGALCLRMCWLPKKTFRAGGGGGGDGPQNGPHSPGEFTGATAGGCPALSCNTHVSSLFEQAHARATPPLGRKVNALGQRSSILQRYVENVGIDALKHLFDLFSLYCVSLSSLCDRYVHDFGSGTK